MAKMKKLTALCAIACGTMAAGFGGPANAQGPATDTRQEVDALKRQVDALMKKVEELSTRSPAAAPVAAPMPGVPAAAPMPGTPGPANAGTMPTAHQFLERKPGKGFTLLTNGGELTLYGNLDLSVDDTTKGLGNAVAADGSRPAGRTGWMPAISSNISYAGVRGFQTLGSLPYSFLYQLETQIDVSATSGTSASNSAQSNSVKGGLTSRNSYIGIGSKQFGAVKIGKTDAPYKNSTARMNPFSGELGDYAVIMGNTGGDNRVEFGTRLSHAIWYESPTVGGFTFNALVSPGQNRAYDNSNIASGEGDCTGGNVPGSGGNPVACNDGSYGAAYSANLAYTFQSFYVTGAYETHKNVNRTSDITPFDPTDVANESAYKFGAQYKFVTGTTVSGIYEKMKRNVPDALQFQNERSRSGFWFALSQVITPDDSLNFGWGHAGRANGDTGQHNTDPGAGKDNRADLYTVAWKHAVDNNLSTYVDYAMTNNHQSGHYDLGAGGRGVTTDCHDATNPDTTGFDPNGNAPHCYAGGKLKGVSVGMRYTF